MQLTIHPEIKAFLLRPIIAQILCLILLVFLIVNIGSKLHSFFSLLFSKPIITVKTVNNQPSKHEETRGISLQSPLFGDYIPQNMNDGSIKQSNLAFTVAGILFAQDAAKSHVIIRESSGKEAVYQVGDSLPGGAVILRISETGVLIKRQGILERLNLPRNELTFDAPLKGIEW